LKTLGPGTARAPGRGGVMGDTLRYGAIMLVAGIGIPIFAALNAQFGARLGVPAAAAVVAFGVAALTALTVLIATGQAGALMRVPGHPAHLYFAGLAIAFYVLTITWVAPRFGVGNAVFVVLVGQMLAATAIDHFGLFGARLRPITWERGSGLVLMAAGLALVQRG
jgi:bacterial/archaeal transporter family-2 protein